jgi:hypothetical protein
MRNWGEGPARNRRLVLRHAVRTRLRIRIWKSSQPESRAESVNLSERGVYFESDLPLNKGEIVEILLKMPEEVTGEPTTEWSCTGGVVRVSEEPLKSGKIGVGVEFWCYQILGREAPPIRITPQRAVSFQMHR